MSQSNVVSLPASFRNASVSADSIFLVLPTSESLRASDFVGFRTGDLRAMAGGKASAESILRAIAYQCALYNHGSPLIDVTGWHNAAIAIGNNAIAALKKGGRVDTHTIAGAIAGAYESVKAAALEKAAAAKEGKRALSDAPAAAAAPESRAGQASAPVEKAAAAALETIAALENADIFAGLFAVRPDIFAALEKAAAAALEKAAALQEKAAAAAAALQEAEAAEAAEKAAALQAAEKASALAAAEAAEAPASEAPAKAPASEVGGALIEAMRAFQAAEKAAAPKARKARKPAAEKAAA